MSAYDAATLTRHLWAQGAGEDGGDLRTVITGVLPGWSAETAHAALDDALRTDLLPVVRAAGAEVTEPVVIDFRGDVGEYGEPLPTYEVTLNPDGLLPASVIETDGMSGEELRWELLSRETYSGPDLTTLVSQLPTSSTVVRRDHGFVAIAPSDVPASLPVPAGLDLSHVTGTNGEAFTPVGIFYDAERFRTGPHGTNPVSRDVYALVFRAGLETVVITARDGSLDEVPANEAGEWEPGPWSDPEMKHGLGLIPLAQVGAFEAVVEPEAPAHAWTVQDGTVIAVATTASPAVLTAVLEHLSATPGEG